MSAAQAENAARCSTATLRRSIKSLSDNWGTQMSKQEQYSEAKSLLREIQYELNTQPLTLKQRGELELHAARLAGVLLRPWLPVDWKRRLIMAGIVLLGIQQAAWADNYRPFLWWLLLPAFSPRIMGECAYFLGALSRKL